MSLGDQEATSPPQLFDLLWETLGVGLTTARNLIELHGGKTIVQSEGPGRGSEFVVRLPVGVPAGPEGRRGSRRVAVQARHILLVEDDDNVREALRRTLTVDGHRVEVARDGPGGVELALATVPEVAAIGRGRIRRPSREAGQP